MARVFLLRCIRTMNYATRSALEYAAAFPPAPSLFFPFFLSVLRSSPFFLRTNTHTYRQARSNRYYMVLRARVALAGRKREEESFCILRRPSLGAPCAINRREKSRTRFSLLKCQISMSVNGYTSLVRENDIPQCREAGARSFDTFGSNTGDKIGRSVQNFGIADTDRGSVVYRHRRRSWILRSLEYRKFLFLRCPDIVDFY